jgi:hypothetical protein
MSENGNRQGGEKQGQEIDEVNITYSRHHQSKPNQPNADIQDYHKYQR